MPPNGLYPIPRHHLNAQSPPTKRPSFNSMDFYAEDLPSAPVKSENTETPEERACRKQEKRERKEQKKLKKQSREVQAAKEKNEFGEKPPTPLADLTPMTPVKKGRFGPRGPYKKREKGPDGMPVSAAKRKRESDAQGSALVASDTGVRSEDSLLNPNFLDGLKKTMGNLGAVFDQPTASTGSPTEPQKKKKGRPPGTKNSVKSTESETLKASESTTTGAAPGEPKPKKPRIEKDKRSDSSGEKPFKMIRTPVPVPSVASALLSAPKRAPVPLPPKPSASPSGGTSESKAGKTKSIEPEPEILVAETPPSQMSQTPATTRRQPPIPFSITQGHTSSSNRPQATHTGCTISLSSPEIPTPSSYNLTSTNSHIIGSQGSVNPLTSSQVDAFTSLNLMRYKQKLSDTPKPRPRSRRAVSEARSTTSDSSSSTSQSIRDMLLRIPKPYTQPCGMKNPFQTQGTRAKKTKQGAQETHDEAPVSVFKGAYMASQRSVNFTDEMEYLTEYLSGTSSSSSSRNSKPLPCLHKATGCTPKGEQILRLSQSDPSLSPSLKPVVVVSESAATATRTALAFHAIATSLLTHSIRARIPIPLGPMPGSWKLYCPSYTHSHVDKYGYGLRTLSLSELPPGSLADGDDEAVYTARLHVPPRSMAFNIAPFAAPPHASARTVGLRTVSEGYKLQVSFLGNGYLRLRVDLGLLLFGKVAGALPNKARGDKSMPGGQAAGVWDFLGVHDKAVVWEPELDELEIEGRKLFSRYDGE
ncbi:hypothetical protein TW65_04138 [Stemphylium lycopersici]|nr:hypothetical protein TW65_04138 [Stemphylium lycopersici]